MTYSLIKPPKGSNVARIDMMNELVSKKDQDQLQAENEQSRKRKWKEQLANVYQCTDAQVYETDHEYEVASTSPFAQAFYAGCVAKQVKSFTKCMDCRATLDNPDAKIDPQGRDAAITLLDKGGLIYPSEALYQLTGVIEQCLMRVIGHHGIHHDTLFQALQEFSSKTDDVPLVGCIHHASAFSIRVLDYYLVSRAQQIATRNTKITDEKRCATIKLRKQAKLQ